MNKLFLAIFISILNSSIAFSSSITAIPGSNFKINIFESRNYNETDLQQLQRAVNAIEAVVNSEEFKEKILNFSYNEEKAFVQNNGLSNLQVYESLMAAAEKYPVETEANQVMDTELQLYKPKWYQSKKVIGYTDMSYRTIFVNQNYYRKASIADIADNMVHEWCHKIGFSHDFKSTERRPYSVPYAVGYIVDDLIAAAGL